jgi:hypothetical protein
VSNAVIASFGSVSSLQFFFSLRSPYYDSWVEVEAMRSLGGRVKYGWGLLGSADLLDLTVRLATRLVCEFPHKQMS